jgi:hypothetical protein
LPSQANDRKAVAKQPRISSIVREIPVAAIDETDNACSPPVGDFQQHRPVALLRVLGTDGNEVGRKLDLSVLQIHRLAQINNAVVVRIGDCQRKIDAASNALVGACVTESLAVENIAARSDFDANNARTDRKNS